MADISKKGTPAPADNRNRGWHGAVSAPMHGYQYRILFSTPTSHRLVGVNCYSALEANSRTTASAMIKVITIRIGCYPPFPICAVPTRKAVEGSRAGFFYANPLTDSTQERKIAKSCIRAGISGYRVMRSQELRLQDAIFTCRPRRKRGFALSLLSPSVSPLRGLTAAAPHETLRVSARHSVAHSNSKLTHV
jgi:hypothetical protein